ncbi:MAG TPA: galactosyltransferase-related protein [Phycisphaerales bacterium]|nr:galactosyltransferase-related protein [Phycisphaerales bacterium]
MAKTHVIISTHTTRHLRATLLGVAIQSPRPATVVVSIDNDRSEVRELCGACAGEFSLPILVVWRAFPGEVRVGQVRNNGVRALAGAGVEAGDWLHLLDGDSVCRPGMLATAERLRAGHDLLIGGRVLLTEEQTGAYDEAALAEGGSPVAHTPEQLAERAARDGRYRRQQFFKRFGLVKAHKPKVLGANHACTLGMYERVNGYDETFRGAWREDDDFGRRVHLAGGRARVAVEDVCVDHLWHPLNPQKRENWSELSSESSGPHPWMPRAGLSNPLPQGELRIERVG